MRKFFKDYREYQRSTSELVKIWYKNHWKGTVLLNVLILAITYVVIFHDDIKEKIIKTKSNNEEVAA
jgi:hypothetical protein